MNQTFNFKRFSQLFIKHTADNYKTYLMAYSVMLGMLFLSMGFVAYLDGGALPSELQLPFFGFILLIAGSIFTSVVFAEYGDKKKAISILSLPASHFEKYLVGWLYSLVIFQLVFVPSFYFIVIIINNLAPLRPGMAAPQLLDLASLDVTRQIFLLYAILHSISLLGSIYFNKHHFIKTAFAFFVCVFALTFLNYKLLRIMLSEHLQGAFPFLKADMRIRASISQPEDMVWTVNIPEQYRIYVGAMFIVVIIILWASSYYKVKEKEV